MWGHHVACGCTVCNSLPRIFLLIAQGSGLPLFVEGVGTRLRVLEAEVRDELSRRGFLEGRLQTPSPGPPPPAPGAAACPPAEPPSAAVATPPATGIPRESQGEASQAAPAVEPRREEKPDTSQAAASPREERSKEEINLEIYPKSCPSAPSRLANQLTPVKVEEAPKSDSVRGVKDAAYQLSEEPEPKEKKSRPEKSRSPPHHHPESSPRRSEPGRARSSKGHKRDRSRDRKRRERSRSPRSEGGKEKKSRPNRPPEPAGPPPSWRDDRTPREPDHPPARWQHPPQGRGWVGPVPYSDHPRWTTGKSRGIVRRAKQENYNRRRRENRGGR